MVAVYPVFGRFANLRFGCTYLSRESWRTLQHCVIFQENGVFFTARPLTNTSSKQLGEVLAVLLALWMVQLNCLSLKSPRFGSGHRWGRSNRGLIAPIYQFDCLNL